MSEQTVALTINVPLSDLSPEAIHDAIIAAAVDRVLGVGTRTKNDEDGTPYEVADNRRLDQMRKEVRDITTARIEAVVAEKVPAIVSEALEGTFQPTTSWGEKKGEPTSMREVILKTATTWLSETVDGRGEKNYNGVPRARWLMQQSVESVFNKELKAEVDKAAAEIKAGLVGKVSTAITETVARLVGLK